MNFTLMHKNIPVLDFLLDEHSGRIIKRGDIHNSRHLPIGTTIAVGIDALNKLNEWWFSRSIPSSRDGLRTAIETLNLKSAAQLILKSNGFSLSDQYWVHSKNSNISWESLNFFDNDFSPDTGEILFGRALGDIAKANLRSPDNTSSGWLKKKWIISDNKRVLMKGGSGVFRQEPFNEVIATNIMRRLSINHIPYTLLFQDDQTYSLCDDFISKNTELIPAWSVKQCLPKGNSESELQHLLRCTDSLGIPNIRKDIDKMLTLDFIINNEDRHFGNFGFIRNADSLEWLGISPIFDCGTSLWYNDLNVGSTDKSSTFKPTHAQQIKLVSDFSWLDFSALFGLNTDICSIFLPSDRVDEARAEAIANVVARCEDLKSKNILSAAVKPRVKMALCWLLLRAKARAFECFIPTQKQHRI